MSSPAPWSPGERSIGLDFLAPLFTADEMRALDAWAIGEQQVPSLELMERAGAEVARVVMTLFPAGPVLIACGKGNNGGDGLVAARHLARHGLAVTAVLLSPAEELSRDSRTNHDRLLQAGGDVLVVAPDQLKACLEPAALVVDALLGTGFEGAPRAPIDAAIEAINSFGSQVLAVDVPSGVDASSGEVGGGCVRADVTVTFQHPKIGLWIAPGKTFAGRIEVVDIGIPAGGRPPGPLSGLIARSVLARVPRRTAASTKFSSGAVLVVGGSPGLTGAACLSCTAAMRAGAGWVRAAVPASLDAIFEVKLTEVMTVPLPEGDEGLAAEAAAAALAAAERADAVVLGPGLGRAEGSARVALRLMGELELPLLVDADGLNALASIGLEQVASRASPTVLTPHAGELARLLGYSSQHVSAHRLGSVREAARRARCTVVLKGDDTLVTGDPAERVAVSEGDSPGLASAGTGDVLSGVIAAFLARGVDPFTAACAGVRAHADAGRKAASRLGADSVIAGDVVEALPEVLRSR